MTSLSRSLELGIEEGLREHAYRVVASGGQISKSVERERIFFIGRFQKERMAQVD